MKLSASFSFKGQQTIGIETCSMSARADRIEHRNDMNEWYLELETKPLSKNLSYHIQSLVILNRAIMVSSLLTSFRCSFFVGRVVGNAFSVNSSLSIRSLMDLEGNDDAALSKC